LHSGGISRAIRCNSVISAVLADLPAERNCQFGGFSRGFRRAIQREIVQIMQFMQNLQKNDLRIPFDLLFIANTAG
jgi:hypothetical protein